MIFHAALRGLIVRCAVKNPVAHFIWNEHEACASIKQSQLTGNPCRMNLASVHKPSSRVMSMKHHCHWGLSFLTATKKFNKRRCMKTVLQRR
jgi:hypothetical protein